LPPFYTWLSGWVSQRIGAAVTPAELAAIALPDFLRMNIRVVDADDRVVAEGRDLAALRRKVRSSPVPVPSAEALHRQWDFGDLPLSREVDRNRLRLIVYPAIEDRGAGVALVQVRSAVLAEALSRTGLVRLVSLALPQQAKYVHKRLADDRELVLLSSGLSLAMPLPDALTRRAFRECFLSADATLPRTQEEFAQRLESRRGGLTEVADELAVTIVSALKELRTARTALAALAPPAFADAIADITAQLQGLLPPTFIETTPRPWLDYLPRYLKAVTRRIERLAGNLKRDTELAAKVKPFSAALRALSAQPSLAGTGEQLEQLRWMIEEFRVSLFAQELRTMMKVSEKRLAEQLELARKEVSG
jgi:ATP-dependent helicase HrpA